MSERIRKILGFLKSHRGVASSTADVAVAVGAGGLLLMAAVGSAIGNLDATRIITAQGDVKTIGQAIVDFYGDNGFFPMFRDGTKTGPSDAKVRLLVSASGFFPIDGTSGSWGFFSSENWASGATTSYGVRAYGHKPDFFSRTRLKGSW